MAGRPLFLLIRVRHDAVPGMKGILAKTWLFARDCRMRFGGTIKHIKEAKNKA